MLCIEFNNKVIKSKIQDKSEKQMVKILDCTLRDGGYINDWDFGKENIHKIIDNLSQANIDLIECGFFEDCEHSKDKSFFSDLNQVNQYISPDAKSDYAVMTRLGKLKIDNIPIYKGSGVSGIKVTFHINEINEAMDYCKQVKSKGYKLFIQPVGTTSYTDIQLIELIHLVNEISPFAFYIVDTLGVMVKKDIDRLFYLVDHNLNQDISIGFHSHNNLQMSFSNAQELVSLNSERIIYVDSSVAGMGRGAGNLNTELICQYLNMSQDGKYHIEYVLTIIDEYINKIQPKSLWGYSIPYYLAAVYNTHPDYASFLINKQTLDVNSIAKILFSLPMDSKEMFDFELIQKAYFQYQTHQIDDSLAKQKILEYVGNKEVLILAPGKTVEKHEKDIIEIIKNKKPVIISVNFKPDNISPDFIFFSNLRRYNQFYDKEFDNNTDIKYILSSNVIQNETDNTLIVNYSDLVNDFVYIKDNATLMLLKLLSLTSCKNILVGGFDGYDYDEKNNYYNDKMETSLGKNEYILLNKQITSFLNKYMDQKMLKFVTPTKYGV